MTFTDLTKEADEDRRWKLDAEKKIAKILEQSRARHMSFVFSPSPFLVELARSIRIDNLEKEINRLESERAELIKAVSELPVYRYVKDAGFVMLEKEKVLELLKKKEGTA